MKVVKMNEVKKEPVVAPLFTGSVSRQNYIGKDLSDRFLISQVNFDRNGRNKFHTHTIEQVLIVTEGKGICATEKEEITVVPGDIVFFPAGEKHWHGAAEGSTFSHLYVMSPDTITTKLED